MLILMCDSCQIRLPAYDAWVEHVLSDHHQGNSVLKKMIAAKSTRESYEKGVMAIIGDLSTITARKIAWHVSNFGLLCDLYYGSNNKYVLFHLDSRDCNEAARAGTTELENTKVEVQWVSNIPVIEWDKLFALPRRPSTRIFVPDQISLPPQYFSLIETIFQQETISHDELTRRHLALTDIASIIQPQYPHATFHPYGSYITGLGSSDSSLNFFVANIQTVSQGTSVGYPATVPTRNTIEEIAWYLSNLPPQSKCICSSITIISTPDAQRFIQFRHVPTNLFGNIYIRNPLPVQRSKLVAFYMTLDDRVRPFLQLVRYWGRFHGLTAVMPGVQKPTLMRNYALMLLALVFLENVQIIPSVQALQLIQKDEREPCPVGPWDGSFCDDKEQVLSYMEMAKSTTATPKVENTDESLTNKVMSLAVEFFNRTALLEPNSLVVCTLLCKFRPKFQFYRESLEQVPEGLERYKQAVESGPFKPICSSPGRNAKQMLSLVVQDPFELTVNVTEHLSPDFLIKFRQICCKTALAFQKLIVPPGKHRNDIGTSIKDLFTPIPPRDINLVQMKLLIGELMCKRREINKKNSQQSNGFATDNSDNSNSGSSNQFQSNPGKYDSYYEQSKPQPLMSIQPFSNNKATKSYPPPLMPQLSQTSYPLPLLGNDYNRRESPVQRPQPLMDAKVNYKLPPARPPPPPPAPIVMANKDTIVKISNDSLYQSIFKQHFGNLASFVENGYLESKMNALWLKCFSELILAVWHKCFKLENVLVKENNSPQFKKHVYSEAIFNFLDINSDTSDDEPSKKKRRDMMGNIEEGEVNDVNVESLMNKITTIPDIPTNYSSTFECFVCKPFFSGRQDISKWMSDKANKNPLEREEEITRKVLIRSNAADLTTNITIKCTVSADMNKEDEQIELWFNESFDKSKQSVENEFFQRFFSLLVPEYAIFRLCQLLDIPNSWQVVNFNK